MNRKQIQDLTRESVFSLSSNKVAGDDDRKIIYKRVEELFPEVKQVEDELGCAFVHGQLPNLSMLHSLPDIAVMCVWSNISNSPIENLEFVKFCHKHMVSHVLKCFAKK